MTNRKFSHAALFCAVTIIVTLTGLLVGCIDIHCEGTGMWEFLFYFGACACLGYWRPKSCWFWPFCFACTLYIVHLWAIRHGYKQPLVERSEEDAIACFGALIPSFVGGFLGAAAGGLRRVFTLPTA